MLSIQIPNIAVHKVSNGWVVQWQQKNPDSKQSERMRRVEAVCIDSKSLLEVIETAAADVLVAND